MTDSERLKELLLKCDPIKDRDLDDDWGDGEIDDIVDSLLENGVIVPPCKVGDTVYVCFYRTRVIECKVAQIIIENIEEIGMSFMCYGGMRFDMRHWEKTVFPTREEAENALAKRSGI